MLSATNWVVIALLGMFVVLQVTHAWMVDDAYITLRTVYNFVHGYGLRWNPGERVQSYTHPLWMFVLSAVYFVTREAFFSTLALSFVVSLAALFVVSLAALFVVLRSDVIKASSYRAPMFLSLLLGSKAFLDYSSSGLENPLTHLLIAGFFTRFLEARSEAASPQRAATWLFGIGGLGFVNRMDTVLIFAPACAYLLY